MLTILFAQKPYILHQLSQNACTVKIMVQINFILPKVIENKTDVILQNEFNLS